MIPLSVPNISGNEWKYVKECLDTNWVSSVGSYVDLFEKKVAEFCGSPYAVAISNGTSALHIGLLLAGVQENDLVILPDITFVASANSITYVGAKPLFIDIDANTWQMDMDLLEEFLRNNTETKNNACYYTHSGNRIAAIMPVHVLGNMCDMDRLMQLANEFHLAVVEDATEGLGSYYKGRHAGTFGIGCLSFNGNKIITTGGGGMVLTADAKLAKKAKHITTQAKADPDEYYHDEIGYNYRLVNILAAMGVAQMEQLPGFIARKKEIVSKYNEQLLKIGGVGNQQVTPHVNSNHWLYTIKVPQQRQLRKFLQQQGIEARPFWVPMNRLPAFAGNLYYHHKDVAGSVYESCISLPCSTGITDKEIDEGNWVSKEIL